MVEIVKTKVTADLRLLSATILRELADAHRREATQLEVQAQRLDYAEAWTRRQTELLAAVAEIETNCLAGDDLDQAFARIARDTDNPIETVRHHWYARVARRRPAARFERDRKIIQLARRGWSNSRIAANVGCAPATVGRAIARFKDTLEVPLDAPGYQEKKARRQS